MKVNDTVFNEWWDTVQKSKLLNNEQKLQKLNEFFNRNIVYAEDIALWGESDYWATPLETLSKMKGDCEDYVIAKYFSLLAAGISDSQLRLIYVKARIGGSHSSLQQAHMVLAYYPNPEDEPLILDNMITDIRPASQRRDLTPVFSFNMQGVFAGSRGDAQLGSGGAGRLTRWQNVLERAFKEGFKP